MLTLNDGRSELWQWDTGRTLSVDADCSQVHFSNRVFGRSIDVDVTDGAAIIPDILLQTDKDLNVWAFVGTAENGYTKISKTFKVNRRNKPADYVFTPPEQTSLEEIKEKIDYLESTQDPDAIKNAVKDYLEQNPVEAPVQSVNGQTGTVELTAEDVGAISDETDPTVPAWAKQPTKPTYTAAEVGALPDTYTPPNQTAQQVGADPAGTAASAVSQHNTDATAHNDLRLALQELSDRINAALDSDDTTLDQMSEVVAYIKSNKSLIDAITTSKVSVADIVNDLVTNVADKPLSAAQGVAIKGLIDNLDIIAGDVGKKLDKPETTPEVGKILQVIAVNDDGTFTCAWADAPIGGVTDVQINDSSVVTDGVAAIPLANGKDVYGAVRQSSQPYYCGIEIVNGKISCNFPHTTGTLDKFVSEVRDNRFLKPFVSRGFDLMVKRAMCDTGITTEAFKGAMIWSDAERISALLRLGCTVDDNGFVKWAAQEVSE